MSTVLGVSTVPGVSGLSTNPDLSTNLSPSTDPSPSSDPSPDGPQSCGYSILTTRYNIVGPTVDLEVSVVPGSQGSENSALNKIT